MTWWMQVLICALAGSRDIEELSDIKYLANEKTEVSPRFKAYPLRDGCAGAGIGNLESRESCARLRRFRGRRRSTQNIDVAVGTELGGSGCKVWKNRQNDRKRCSRNRHHSASARIRLS
jgi:hypothetical protein